MTTHDRAKANLEGPTCGKCGREMTPQNARIRPELFLHDACLPPELMPAKKQQDRAKAAAIECAERLLLKSVCDDRCIDEVANIIARHFADLEAAVERAVALDKALGRLEMVCRDILEVYDQLSPPDRPCKPVIMNRGDMELLRKALKESEAIGMAEYDGETGPVERLERVKARCRQRLDAPYDSFVQYPSVLADLLAIAEGSDARDP